MKQFIGLDAGKFEASKRALAAMLQRRLQDAGGIAREAIRETAAEVAEDLSARTFPSSQAIGLAVKAMRFDLRLVYCTPGKAYEILRGSAGDRVAGAFYAAWKRGDISRAERVIRQSGSPISGIIIGEALRPALRESVRNKDGRVACDYPLQLVSDEELSAHATEAIREIGKTASGWSACAEKLGGDGNAVAWKGTAKHGSAGGDVEWSDDEFGVRVVMENHQPLSRKHISPGQVAAIMRPAREKLMGKLAGIGKGQAA
jgi:hypothetical protein